MGYKKDKYFDIMKQTLDNLAIKNQYKLKLYDEVLYYRLLLETKDKSYPEKAMTLTLDAHCLKQLLNYYHWNELTKDDVIMIVSYITYINIYAKCKEYLENIIEEAGDDDDVKSLTQFRDKAKNETDKIYSNDKNDILYIYEAIIEEELLNYQYFTEIG